jgi:hypothetical protein
MYRMKHNKTALKFNIKQADQADVTDYFEGHLGNCPLVTWRVYYC